MFVKVSWGVDFLFWPCCKYSLISSTPFCFSPLFSAPLHHHNPFAMTSEVPEFLESSLNLRVKYCMKESFMLKSMDAFHKSCHGPVAWVPGLLLREPGMPETMRTALLRIMEISAPGTLELPDPGPRPSADATRELEERLRQMMDLLSVLRKALQDYNVSAKMAGMTRVSPPT